MTATAPTFREQADAVETNLLSQQAWLRQALQEHRRRGGAKPYGAICTELHLPGFEAASATLNRLASVEERHGTEAIEQALKAMESVAGQGSAPA